MLSVQQLLAVVVKKLSLYLWQLWFEFGEIPPLSWTPLLTVLAVWGGLVLYLDEGNLSKVERNCVSRTSLTAASATDVAIRRSLILKVSSV